MEWLASLHFIRECEGFFVTEIYKVLLESLIKLNNFMNVIDRYHSYVDSVF